MEVLFLDSSIENGSQLRMEDLSRYLGNLSVAEYNLYLQISLLPSGFQGLLHTLEGELCAHVLVEVDACECVQGCGEWPTPRPVYLKLLDDEGARVKCHVTRCTRSLQDYFPAEIPFNEQYAESYVYQYQQPEHDEQYALPLWR
jgi:hypothetical protein